MYSAPAGQVANSNQALAGPKQISQLTIMKAENGYIIQPPYYGGEAKVATAVDDMLDIVKSYFEDKPEQNE